MFRLYFVPIQGHKASMFESIPQDIGQKAETHPGQSTIDRLKYGMMHLQI